jgi:hypothetical protein
VDVRPVRDGAFSAGEVVWYRGKEARFLAYRGESAATIRFDGTGIESAVRASKLGRSRRESLDLALVSR